VPLLTPFCWLDLLCPSPAGDIPDPHLAAGSLCLLLSRQPLVAIMFFRIETKASEVWDGVDTSGPRSARAASPRRSLDTSASALTMAERTAKNTRSVFAAQFLRAFHLSTRGSCAPWPANAYPLLQLVTATVIEHAQAYGTFQFLGQFSKPNWPHPPTPFWHCDRSSHLLSLCDL